jgi:hypothetical protein
MLSFDTYEILGVILSAVASIVIGGAWYSPFLFGPMWMRETGLTEERMKNMRTTPAQAVSLAIVLGLLFALLMNVLFTWIGVRTVAQGALLAAACSLTFYVVPLLIHAVFEDSSKKVWVIYASHELLLAIVTGAIVSWSILA